VVAAPEAPQRAVIQVPAPGATTTFPLHLLARVGRPGEQITAVVQWPSGAHLWATVRTLRGEDGQGLLIGSLDCATISPNLTPPKAGGATLELRDSAGRLLAEQHLTVAHPGDAATQAITVYWVQNERLVPKTVHVPRTPRIAAAALDVLLWGPPLGSPASLTTALPLPQQVLTYPGRQPNWGPRVTLRGVSIAHGIATADFSRELAAYGGGSTRVQLIRQQISKTLSQFPSVRAVRIAIEGQTEGVLEP
jgi:hypothetical protein